jgi:hypothetical protein
MPSGNNPLATRPSHSHRLKPTTSDTSSFRGIKISENKEIVVRDKNGGYKLDVPALPNGLVGENGEELGELDPDESGELGLEAGDLGGRDKESTFLRRRQVGKESRVSNDRYLEFDAALVEMMIRHRNRQSSGEPDGRLQRRPSPPFTRVRIAANITARNFGHCTPELAQKGRVPG